MSQIAIQKQRLTLEQIAPIWMERIKNWDNISNSNRLEYTIAIRGSSYECFIGEAHGFSSTYANENTPDYCKECHLFCGSDHGIASFFKYKGSLYCPKDGFIKDKQQLLSMLDAFCDHWNQKHVSQ